MTRRRHLAHPDYPGGTRSDGTRYVVTFCNRSGRPATEVTLVDDPADADCRRCAAALETDLNPPEVPGYLRHRAYSRALAALRDRYRAEFDEILAETIPAVVAEETADR